VFGKTAERVQERQLIADYRAAIEDIIGRLEDIDMDKAFEIARLPEKIRGFGHVKQASIDAARTRWAVLDGELSVGQSRRTVYAG
jgi:indolepyruvate ferredoxin oxidoreductase